MIKKILFITVFTASLAYCSNTQECSTLPPIHQDNPSDGMKGSCYVERASQHETKIVELKAEKTFFEKNPGTDDESKKFSQKKLSKIKKELSASFSTKRILSCSGGGSKGLISATTLAYLEELMNHSDNKPKRNEILKELGRENDPDQWLYLSDIFDVGAGTSTGSVLTACYFYNQAGRYRAVDAARVYMHHSADIFGTQNTLGSAQISSTYCHKPYEKLLKAFTGNQTVGSSIQKKRVYIYGVSKNEVICFRSYQHNEKPYSLYRLDNTPLWQAVRASSAAPKFFDPEQIETCDGIRLIVTDGGTSVNSPAWVTLQNEQHSALERNENCDFELYSFGTGYEQYQTDEKTIVANTAIVQAINVLLTSTAINESEALKSCRKATQCGNLSIKFFAHINPLLEAGMALDSKDAIFIEKAIKCAMSSTQGNSFKKIVEKLGFTMPDHDSIKDSLLNKIHAIQINILKADASSPQSEQLLQYLARELKNYNYGLFLRGKVWIIEGVKDPVQ